MLIVRKMEINHSKRDTSHDGIRGDRWAQGGGRRRNQIYRAQLAAPFRKAIATFF